MKKALCIPTFGEKFLLFYCKKNDSVFKKGGVYNYDVKTFFSLKLFLENQSILMFDYWPLL